MVFVVRIPYWIFVGEIHGYIDQVETVSKTIINQVNPNKEEDLPKTFIELHRSAAPQMSRSYWIFCGLYWLTNIMMFGIIWCLTRMFGLFDLFEDIPNLSSILKMIKANLPSEGTCTLLEVDTGGVLREIEHTCIINMNHFYEWSTIGIMAFYGFGVVLSAINIQIVLLRCAFPNLKR